MLVLAFCAATFDPPFESYRNLSAIFDSDCKSASSNYSTPIAEEESGDSFSDSTSSTKISSVLEKGILGSDTKANLETGPVLSNLAVEATPSTRSTLSLPSKGER